MLTMATFWLNLTLTHFWSLIRVNTIYQNNISIGAFPEIIYTNVTYYEDAIYCTYICIRIYSGRLEVLHPKEIITFARSFINM